MITLCNVSVLYVHREQTRSGLLLKICINLIMCKPKNEIRETGLSSFKEVQTYYRITTAGLNLIGFHIHVYHLHY